MTSSHCYVVHLDIISLTFRDNILRIDKQMYFIYKVIFILE